MRAASRPDLLRTLNSCARNELETAADSEWVCHRWRAAKQAERASAAAAGFDPAAVDEAEQREATEVERRAKR